MWTNHKQDKLIKIPIGLNFSLNSDSLDDPWHKGRSHYFLLCFSCHTSNCMARSTLMMAPSSSFVLATTCVFLLFLAVNGYHFRIHTPKISNDLFSHFIRALAAMHREMAACWAHGSVGQVTATLPSMRLIQQQVLCRCLFLRGRGEWMLKRKWKYIGKVCRAKSCSPAISSPSSSLSHLQWTNPSNESSSHSSILRASSFHQYTRAHPHHFSLHTF